MADLRREGAKLLVNDKVAAVFGCWTSASRKAVLPVFEKENGMLYYPTFYEGLEQSKNVIYTGQEATQQILDGLDWVAKEKEAKTFYPDRLGLHLAAHLEEDRAQAHREVLRRARCVGEEYYPLGHTQFGSHHQQDQADEARCDLRGRGRRLQRRLSTSR